ncbi:MAG: cytochrome c biogenesis protein CcsA [Planctomycetes bacterium]|nr:cytochrome c biogenesis protein CcsA [Planctomycetota bacterium]
MANRKLLFGFGTFALLVGLVVIICLIGAYSGYRRVEREQDQRDKFAALNTEISAEALDAVANLPMMYKERVQPFDSIARSKLRQVSGSRKLYGVPATALMAEMLFNDAFDWQDTPLFHVAHEVNKERLGVASVDSLASLGQIKGSLPLMEAMGEARDRAMDGASTKVDDEVFTLLGLGEEAKQRFRSLLLFVPPTQAQYNSETPDYLDWHLVDDAGAAGHDPKLLARMGEDLSALRKNWTARNNAGIVAAAKGLRATITEMSPVSLPSQADFDLERRFNRVQPFVYAGWLFFGTAAFGIFAFAFGKKWLKWGAFAFAVAGLGLMAWGFYARTVLGFQVTITNLYESMVATAAGLTLIGVGCSFLPRVGSVFLAIGGLGSWVLLLIVDAFSVKFDPGIGGTIAVLANNVWVHIHVPVVMLAYSAFALAFLASLLALPWSLFSDRKGRDPDLKIILKVSTIAVDVGCVLMFAGLILGGIWAYDSWGRFWGWDPKETWALILFLYYMVIVHGRFTNWLNAFWTNWLLFLGGNMLLWTYYGTNELLAGLHSYANSAGGAGFWDNFVHERNRWFVWTTLGMGGISFLSLCAYLMTGGAKRAHPGGAERPVDAGIEADDPDFTDEPNGLVRPN